ncbi:Dickkopf N-terminal cysteine-rich domain-containing protein [Pseudomonas sp.]
MPRWPTITAWPAVTCTPCRTRRRRCAADQAFCSA